MLCNQLTMKTKMKFIYIYAFIYLYKMIKRDPKDVKKVEFDKWSINILWLKTRRGTICIG